MENDALPQYMRIARSIAKRIADGELMEGEKLSGRSKLSSEYNVSPETIRKAVQVLQDRAVVIVREQSGVYVLSAEQARQCLAGFKDGGGLIGKKHRLRQLLEQQQALGRELQELCGSILDEMILPAQAVQSLPGRRSLRRTACRSCRSGKFRCRPCPDSACWLRRLRAPLPSAAPSGHPRHRN